MDNNFGKDLESFLQASADRYVVERTLKSTPNESTQVVYRKDDNGNPTIGPFVRKRFDANEGRGGAYDQLLRMQTKGRFLPHQPLVYECERQNNSVEVVMEYVDGQTLHDVVTTKGAGVDLATRVIPQLCDAILELHESFEQPLIHRDIKPSNVMLTNDGNLKLIDLGIARTYRNDAQRDTVRYGTPGYAPPEQFGYGQTSVRSDVYALGMTLAFCLTGEEPTNELRDRSFRDPCISPALQEVLVRATQFDPSMRHATARAFKNDFLNAVGAKANGTDTHATTPESTDAQPPATGVWAVLNSTPFVVLGIIWNILLAVAWGIIGLSCVASLIRPSENMLKYPFWFVLLMHVFLLYIPWTMLSYLLCDKRRLRKHKPFSRLSWRIELPVCIFGSLASMAIVVIIYNVMFKGSVS